MITSVKGYHDLILIRDLDNHYLLLRGISQGIYYSVAHSQSENFLRVNYLFQRNYQVTRKELNKSIH